jgi:hypothetical protein
MPAPLALILPALLPVVADALRAVFNRLTNGAGARPANVQEAVALMQAEAEKLKAIADLDRPSGNISQWVADLRAAFRYVAAGIIIVSAYGLVVLRGLGLDVSDDILGYALDMTGSVFAFLFGDRMYTYLRRK